jgi:hypothetical protein
MRESGWVIERSEMRDNGGVEKESHCCSSISARPHQPGTQPSQPQRHSDEAHLIVVCAPMAAPSSREWKHKATPISMAVRNETLRLEAEPGVSSGELGGSTCNTKLSLLPCRTPGRRRPPVALLPPAIGAAVKPSKLSRANPLLPPPHSTLAPSFSPLASRSLSA